MLESFQEFPQENVCLKNERYRYVGYCFGERFSMAST